MPYVAKNLDDDELVIVEDSDPLANFCCPECGEGVAYVREHFHQNTDGTVSAHFRYHSCGCAGVKKSESANRSESSRNSGGSGESNIHKHRKWTALQSALNDFEYSSYGLEQWIGDKRADAVLEFAEPHSDYGRGLVIEYQHKNEGKDIIETERHYARHEFTTLWVWEDQFDSFDGAPQVNLFDGRVCTPWPHAVPKKSEWSGTYDSVFGEHSLMQKSSVPAKVPRHWYIPTDYEYWQEEKWSKRFRYNDTYRHEQMMLEGLICTLPTSRRPTATLPEPAADEIIYKSGAWERQEVVEPPPRLVFSPTLPYVMVDKWLPDDRKGDSFNVERPLTPFDDVQCHNCEHYQYAPSAELRCPTCGILYDWKWNVKTGRIQSSSIPEFSEASVTSD